ncbi:MAG TPA: hypothetical protein VFO65_07860 [Acidimicrobiales bacterium]|nr:hypothetical protein [Acidimicrobiales bacterium]
MAAARTWLWTAAVRRGLFGGSRLWMTIFATMGTARLLKRLAGKERVYCERLGPGEQLIISNGPLPPADGGDRR